MGMSNPITYLTWSKWAKIKMLIQRILEAVDRSDGNDHLCHNSFQSLRRAEKECSCFSSGERACVNQVVCSILKHFCVFHFSCLIIVTCLEEEKWSIEVFLCTRWSMINDKYKKSGGQAWIFGRRDCFLPIIGSQLIWQLKYIWCWWNARVLKIFKDFFSTKLLKLFWDSSTYKSWCRPKHLFL